MTPTKSRSPRTEAATKTVSYETTTAVIVTPATDTWAGSPVDTNARAAAQYRHAAAWLHVDAALTHIDAVIENMLDPRQPTYNPFHARQLRAALASLYERVATASTVTGVDRQHILDASRRMAGSAS